MKTLVENLESDKNQLQAQLQEVGSIKLNMVRQYEETIATLKKDMANERERLIKGIEKYKRDGSDHLKNSDKDPEKSSFDVDRKSVECQTVGMHLEVVDNLKKSLKHLAEQCRQLDGDLDNLSLSEFGKGVEEAPSSKEEVSIL